MLWHWMHWHMHCDWLLVVDWKWHMLLMYNRAIDRHMNWVRNWLLDDIWNFFLVNNWSGHWHWHGYIYPLLDMNWVRTIDWVRNVDAFLFDDFIGNVFLDMHWVGTIDWHGVRSVNWNLYFIRNSLDNRIWTRHLDFLDDLNWNFLFVNNRVRRWDMDGHMNFFYHLVGLWDEHFDGVGTIDILFHFYWNPAFDDMGHWNVDVFFHVMFRMNWNVLDNLIRLWYRYLNFIRDSLFVVHWNMFRHLIWNWYTNCFCDGFVHINFVTQVIIRIIHWR